MEADSLWAAPVLEGKDYCRSPHRRRRPSYEDGDADDVSSSTKHSAAVDDGTSTTPAASTGIVRYLARHALPDLLDDMVLALVAAKPPSYMEALDFLSEFLRKVLMLQTEDAKPPVSTTPVPVDDPEEPVEIVDFDPVRLIWVDAADVAALRAASATSIAAPDANSPSKLLRQRQNASPAQRTEMARAEFAASLVHAASSALPDNDE